MAFTASYFSMPNTVLSSDCYLDFNTNSILPGWYAAAIQLEDFTSKTSATALSSVPIQFLVQVINITSSCDTKFTIFLFYVLNKITYFMIFI